jgi:hypothetical protein
LEMVGSLLKIECMPQSTSRTPTFPHFHSLTRCFCQVLKDCATLRPESLDPPRGWGSPEMPRCAYDIIFVSYVHMYYILYQKWSLIFMNDHSCHFLINYNWLSFIIIDYHSYLSLITTNYDYDWLSLILRIVINYNWLSPRIMNSYHQSLTILNNHQWSVTYHKISLYIIISYLNMCHYYHYISVHIISYK